MLSAKSEAGRGIGGRGRGGRRLPGENGVGSQGSVGADNACGHAIDEVPALDPPVHSQLATFSTSTHRLLAPMTSAFMDEVVPSGGPFLRIFSGAISCSPLFQRRTMSYSGVGCKAEVREPISIRPKLFPVVIERRLSHSANPRRSREAPCPPDGSDLAARRVCVIGRSVAGAATRPSV